MKMKGDILTTNKHDGTVKEETIFFVIFNSGNWQHCTYTTTLWITVYWTQKTSERNTTTRNILFLFCSSPLVPCYSVFHFVHIFTFYGENQQQAVKSFMRSRTVRWYANECRSRDMREKLRENRIEIVQFEYLKHDDDVQRSEARIE